MIRNPLLADIARRPAAREVAAAVVVALIVIILSPGVAVTGIIALAALLLVGLARLIPHLGRRRLVRTPASRRPPRGRR